MRYKLGSISKILNGRAYKQDELLSNGKYKVLRVGNFFTSDRWYYSDLELDDNKYCEKGDLLYAWSANFGPRIWDEGKTIYHYHIWKIVPDESIVIKEYLYYLLIILTDSFKSSVHGSVMAHLTKSDMENFEIDVPDLETQKKIVRILSALDQKIELNNKTLEILNQVSAALFKDLYENMNTSKKMSLGELCSIKYGKNLPSKNLLEYGYSVYGANGIIGYYSEKMYDKPQVLVSCRGVAGAVHISEPESFVTNNSLVLECDSKYHHFVKEYSLNRRYDDYATGSAQPQITINNIKDHQLKIPVDDENLELFNKSCDILEERYFLIIDQNKLLNKTRDTLLPELISGELNLDGAHL